MVNRHNYYVNVRLSTVWVDISGHGVDSELAMRPLHELTQVDAELTATWQPVHCVGGLQVGAKLTAS